MNKAKWSLVILERRPSTVTWLEEQQQGIRRIEARALKYFIDDLLTVCAKQDVGSERHSRLTNFEA